MEMSAISAAEKVDGFTRKSVRKAQRQRVQGSSQFAVNSSRPAAPEISALPQLKGKRIKPGNRLSGSVSNPCDLPT